jgi:alkyl sulfatase BDS1-like metallo-beta-lactamase superfamily hydrolase
VTPGPSSPRRGASNHERAGEWGETTDQLRTTAAQARVNGRPRTIVDAPDGLVIIDTTLSTELATAGLDLFRKELGNDKPVVAVIYTHTHFDHYAGVKGVVDKADVASGKVPIIAPGAIESFNKHAIGENVITGSAMSHRMGYTFQLLLPHCDCGLVTIGLSAGTSAMNSKFSYLAPTDASPRPGGSPPRWLGL